MLNPDAINQIILAILAIVKMLMNHEAPEIPGIFKNMCSYAINFV